MSEQRDPNQYCPTLMVQGTSSDAGKSFMVTALGHYFKKQGFNVAPFKPQNMALNSAVTADGGEIGRAQAVQAEACGIQATVDMNPVLLKPNSDTGAQIIIQGHALDNMQAQDYHAYKAIAKQAVLESYQRLCHQYELIIVEGAGSPAEINLRANDIANMGFAEAVDCPVILIADIDRGGVFAQLVGTLQLLSDSEKARVKGFIINRFRGDKKLLDPGLDWLTKYTGIPVLGVLPYLQNFHLDAEDALPNDPITNPENGQLKVVITTLPRISNHTDFDALRLHPDVTTIFAKAGEPLPPADLIILPGSKNVRADLDWLKQQGWDIAIKKHLRYGGKLMGICGGFQMLGMSIDDPLGIESTKGTSQGLALLEMHTTLQANKTLQNVSGQLLLDTTPVNISGYEIHAGISQGPALTSPLCDFGSHFDGARSTDGQIIGTYLHGIFDENIETLLRWAGLETNHRAVSLKQRQQECFEKLVETIENHVDTNLLHQLIE